MPRRAAQQYFRKIRRLLEQDRRMIWRAWLAEIRPRVREYREVMAAEETAVPPPRLRLVRHVRDRRGGGLATNDALEDIRRILQRLRRSGEILLSDTTLAEHAREFVEAVNAASRAAIKQQMSTVLGFDPTATEPWLSSFLETAVQENVSWIKSIAGEYHDKIESVVTQGARRGANINDMAAEIAEIGDVSMRRAKFIARDQLGSLYGDLTKARHTRIGLRRFTWRTSQDERVRDEHAAFDDKVFDWATGAGPEGLIPGEDFNCRCTAEPLEEELLEVAEE